MKISSLTQSLGIWAGISAVMACSIPTARGQISKWDIPIKRKNTKKFGPVFEVGLDMQYHLSNLSGRCMEFIGDALDQELALCQQLGLIDPARRGPEDKKVSKLTERRMLFQKAVDNGCDPLELEEVKPVSPSAVANRYEASLKRLKRMGCQRSGEADFHFEQCRFSNWPEQQNEVLSRHLNCFLIPVRGIIQIEQFASERIDISSNRILSKEKDHVLIGDFANLPADLKTFPYQGYFLTAESGTNGLKVYTLESNDELDEIVATLRELLEMYVRVHRFRNEAWPKNNMYYVDTTIISDPLIREAEEILTHEITIEEVRKNKMTVAEYEAAILKRDRELAVAPVKRIEDAIRVFGEVVAGDGDPRLDKVIRWTGHISSFSEEGGTLTLKTQGRLFDGKTTEESFAALDDATKEFEKAKSIYLDTKKSAPPVLDDGWKAKIRNTYRQYLDTRKAYYAAKRFARYHHGKHTITFSFYGTPFESRARRVTIKLNEKVSVIGVVRDINLDEYLTRGTLHFDVVPQVTPEQTVVEVSRIKYGIAKRP